MSADVEPRLELAFNLMGAPFGARPSEIYTSALEICGWADGLTGISTSVYLSEHHGIEDGYLPSPIVFAAAVAGRTTRLRLTVMLLLPLYHPLRLAEDLAVLDLIGRGRATFLLGAGYRPEEFAQFGVALSDRSMLMDEGLEVLTTAWMGERFEFRGSPARVTPQPFQAPRPPLLVAGSSRAAARRAARLADGFAPTTNPDLVDAYREALAALGKDPGPAPAATADGPYQVIVGVSDDPDEFWKRIGPHCVHEINSYAAWLRQGFGENIAPAFGDNPPYYDVADVDDLRARGRYLVLTPTECIQWAHDHGGHLKIAPLVGGVDPDLAWKGLRTIEANVLPALTGTRSP